jgi:aminoglycoside phosphotransferase (APT) family kinase protein
MREEYLGILGPADPLYTVLASRAFPDITEPVFHVSRMSRDTVYKYTEEKTGQSLIGKFFDPSRNNLPERVLRVDEYDNLRAIRAFGFDAPPHFVVRPISHERKIGLALIEEFIEGLDLDYYFKAAIYEGKNRYLEAKLAKLASFFFTFHRTTLRASYVDLEAQNEYFQKILDTLCDENIVTRPARNRYLGMRDMWLEDHTMRSTRAGIVHGDPTPTNFIFTRDGDIVAIDLERMKEADPVFDLGMVCAEIKHAFLWRTGNFYASEPYITHFFSHYASHSSHPSETFRKITQRNPFYMALAEMRIARNRYLDVEYRKKLAHESLQCLEHGLSLLQGPGGP